MTGLECRYTVALGDAGLTPTTAPLRSFRRRALGDDETRRKVPMLTEDLIALGFDPITVHPLPLCAALPDCGDSAAAFGCLYVTEASYGYKWLCGEDAVANCERNR